MNKKETLEIRRQFTEANCTISRICGCYVDAEKNRVLEMKDAFLSLPEDEIHKYFDIFKKTLGGTIGKQLLNLSFPLEEEMGDGRQTMLLALRDSALKDDALLDAFYDRIIESYNFGENYLILLIHARYDVPGKASDHTEMFDASDTVYEYVLGSLCPVKLSKAGLMYNAEENLIEDCRRNWLVNRPDKGFLFPAFTDRTGDIHSMLYFSKNPEKPDPDFVKDAFGCAMPLTAKSQRDVFASLVEETLGENCDYEAALTLEENIASLAEAHDEDAEPLSLSKPEIKKLLEKSGAGSDAIENFEVSYSDFTGDDKATFDAANLVSKKTFEVSVADIKIQAPPDETDRIKNRIVDGVPCLVIPLNDSVTVNGIRVKNDISDK